MAELSAETPPIRADRDEDRLEFILAAQAHCDHYLSPLAEPAGKSVLVAAGYRKPKLLRSGWRRRLGPA